MKQDSKFHTQAIAPTRHIGICIYNHPHYCQTPYYNVTNVRLSIELRQKPAKK